MILWAPGPAYANCHAYSFLLFVLNLKGMYRGHDPIKLVRINMPANTNKMIASVPEITLVK
jgi:hypothetical protein